jgi:hypothetical protein
MTGDARYSIVIKRTFDFRVFRQRAGKQRGGVMTGLAMPREFDAPLRLQIFDVLLIEGFAKGIAMR